MACGLSWDVCCCAGYKQEGREESTGKGNTEKGKILTKM